MVNIVVYFSDKGVPKTGLSPTIDVWELDGTHVVNAQAMTEVAGGFYYYNFSGYDEDEDYCIRADGGGTLKDIDRYKYASNENGEVTQDLTDIKGTGFVKNTHSLVNIEGYVDDIPTLDANLEDVAFGGAVYIDTDNGSVGTAFPLGTPTDPVDNLADAITITAARNLRKFIVSGSITLTSGYSHWTFESWGGPERGSVNLNGQSVDDCQLVGLLISGSSTGKSDFRDCTMDTTTMANGVFWRCAISTSMTFANGGNYFFYDCYGDDWFTFYYPTGSAGVRARGLSANIIVRDMRDGMAWLEATGYNGNIIFHSSCNDGYANVQGVGDLDNSGTGLLSVTNEMVEYDDVNDILTDTNEIQGKLPTDYIMGSSVQSSKDDEIDDILADTSDMQPRVAVIEIDTNEIQGKLPNDYIMGSAVQTSKDDEIDDILADTADMQPKVDTINTRVDQSLSTTESNIRGGDGDDLKDISDQIDMVQSAISGISNVTLLSVALPMHLIRPSSGNAYIKVEIAVKDNAGSMNDPDGNQLALTIYNPVGTSRDANLYKDSGGAAPLDAGTGTFVGYKKTERAGIGLYYCYYKVAFDATEETLYFKFGWEEVAVALYEYRATIVSDEEPDIESIRLTVEETNTYLEPGGPIYDNLDGVLTDTSDMQPKIDQSLSTTESNIRGADNDDLKDISDEIGSLNDLSAAQVKAEADQALIDYDPPTKTELDTAESNIIAEIDVNEGKIDTLQTDVTSIETLVLRALGLAQENYYLDSTTYDGDNNLLTGRLRIYDSAVNVGTGTGVIATYNIVAVYTAGVLTTYEVKKA